MFRLLFLFLTLSFFTACNSNEANTSTEGEAADEMTVKEATNPTHGDPDDNGADKFCFLKVTGDDVNKQDSTFINLEIIGVHVTGEKHWHPYGKDGAHGTLKGTKNGSQIKALYSYTIEGAEQTEELIFSISAGKLLQKVGELEEDGNGNFKLKDPAAAKFVDEYPRVLCSDRKLL